MVTIHDKPIFLAGVSDPEPNWWARVKQSVAFAVLGFCGCASDVESFRQDQHIRQTIRESMRWQMGYSHSCDAMESAIVATARDDEYHLTGYDSLRAANNGVTRTEKQWDEYFDRIGVNPVTFDFVPRRAQIIPRFAAASVLSIRYHLGSMPYNEANVLLVQRKYYELCRKRNVRHLDAASHEQFVLNAFFNEDVLDRIGRTRKRLPAWVHSVFGLSKPDAAPLAAC